jgi:transposase
MKSIVRKETGEDWNEYLKRLIREEEGNNDPTDDELRRFDKSRKGKRVSNEEWESKTDPESRVTRMKDGRTHLAYKAEHVVDLESEIILAAEIYDGDQGDTGTIEDSVHQAQLNLQQAEQQIEIKAVVADKGYHSADVLEAFEQHTTYRAYIPEPAHKHRRKWIGKRKTQQQAVYSNRRRSRSRKGRTLQRLRSERVERSFAHVCETGGARRSYLRGKDKVKKRYLIATAARNLATLMRHLFQMGTARGPRSMDAILQLAVLLYIHLWRSLKSIFRTYQPSVIESRTQNPQSPVVGLIELA